MSKSTPDEELDDLLAAPDAVVGSERERKKLASRRKQDEARKQREQSGKLPDPSQEDLLADLIRVAEDPDSNPWWHHRSLSKRRYELFGHYSIEAVTRQFGQFEHAKQQAGLAVKVGERKFATARTQASLREHDERYMRRYLLPHVNKFPELQRAANGWRCGLVISDLHALYLDPFTWDVFLDACADIEPDVIYLNGDVLDGLQISNHPKVPGAVLPLQLEFDFARGLFRELRNKVPSKTRIVWGAGNHGLDRLVRYLTQMAQSLAGLRNLRFDKLAELDELEIDLVQGGTFVSPAGTEDDAPRRILWDTYMVTHGTTLGMHPASAELRRWGMSGTSGHTHRAGMHFGATFKDRALSWMTTPMSCMEDAGRHYIKDYAGWQKGFGIFFISPTGSVRQYPVLTDAGEAIIEGRIYTRGKKMPTRDTKAKSYWLKRMGLNPSDYI